MPSLSATAEMSLVHFAKKEESRELGTVAVFACELLAPKDRGVRLRTALPANRECFVVYADYFVDRIKLKHIWMKLRHRAEEAS